MSNIPKDLEKIIAEIIAHKKIKEELELEYLYDYIYYEYDQDYEYKEEKETIIKISL